MNTNQLYTLRTALAETLHVKENADILQHLFNHYSTVQSLLNADEHELSKVEGITPYRAKQIVGSLKLARVLNQAQVYTDYIRSPQDAFQLLRYDIGHLEHEEVWILLLNTKNRVLQKTQIAIGSINSCIVSPREIFKKAIQINAASLIMVHNHPSQQTEPSQEDIRMSSRLKEIGELMGIELLDSIIVSTHQFTSLKEQGLL